MKNLHILNIGVQHSPRPKFHWKSITDKVACRGENFVTSYAFNYFGLLSFLRMTSMAIFHAVGWALPLKLRFPLRFDRRYLTLHVQFTTFQIYLLEHNTV